MKRLLKWIMGGLGLLLGLVVVAVLVLTLLVDPNDYRDEIAAQVQQHTGRELKIEGEIALSFFPWLGLELGRMELGNAQGFGPEPFASIEAADARVKILPLFAGRVEMATVVLHGLNLSLERRADGVTNWDDLAGTGEPAVQEEKPVTSPEQALAALDIGGIEIRDANVHWRDAVADQSVVVSGFNLTSGAISFDKPFPLAIAARIESSRPSLKATIDLATDIGLDLSQQRYSMGGTKLSLDASGDPIPGGRASLTLRGDLAADLEKQSASAKGLLVQGMGATLTADVVASNILEMPAASGNVKLVLTDPKGIAALVSLPPDIKPEALKGSTVETTFALDLGAAQMAKLTPFKLSALGIELDASVQGEKIIDAPAFKGELSSGEFVPRKILSDLGIALPEMADPSVMTKARLSSHFDAGLDHAALQGLKLQLDQTTFSGDASVRQFKAPVIRYDLVLDEIDVDRYLPPPAEKPVPQQEAAAVAPAAASALPLELLRSLDINGSFRVGKVKVMNLRSDTIVTTVRAEKGQFRVHPLSAKLYQGGYSGDLRFDVRTDTPKLGMDEKLSGVEAGPLLKDFLGKDYVTGKANLAAKMTASGIEPMVVRKSLNGIGSFSFDNGQVNGFNIGELIRKAYALYKKQPVPKEEVKQTDFTSLKGSFAVKNGLVSTNDLSARTPLFKVAGKGTAHLVSEQLDMRLDTTVVSDLKNAANQTIDELKGVTVPITIKGSFGDPKFGVDVASVLRAKVEAAVEKKKQEIEEKANARVEQEQEKAKERVEQEKKKLEQQLQDKLKNMLKF
jgi:AsmA protein